MTKDGPRNRSGNGGGKRPFGPGKRPPGKGFSKGPRSGPRPGGPPRDRDAAGGGAGGGDAAPWRNRERSEDRDDRPQRSFDGPRGQDRPRGDRPAWKDRGDRPDRPPRGDKPAWKDRGDRPDRPPRERAEGFRSDAPRRDGPRRDGPGEDRPRGEGFRGPPRGKPGGGFKGKGGGGFKRDDRGPREDRGDRPRFDKPRGDRPFKSRDEAPVYVKPGRVEGDGPRRFKVPPEAPRPGRPPKGNRPWKGRPREDAPPPPPQDDDDAPIEAFVSDVDDFVSPETDRAADAPRAKRSDRREQTFEDGGDIWIWGLHAAAAVLANPVRRVRECVVTRQAAAKVGIDIDDLPANTRLADMKDLDARLPEGAVHQGVAVRVKPLDEISIDDVAADGSRPLAILDQVTDPQNVGAIFRSAAAFDLQGVVLQTRRAPLLGGALAKAATGAVETVAEIRTVNVARAIDALTDAGWRVVGLDGSAETTLSDALATDEPVAIVLGAEGEGLRPAVAKACTLLARIPMGGAMESLNVSNAAAIAFHEMARRNGAAPAPPKAPAPQSDMDADDEE